MWIGFQDFHTEGNFEWTDGSSGNYTNWDSNQPNDDTSAHPEGEDCTIVGKNGYWHDTNCGFPNAYICKKLG